MRFKFRIWDNENKKFFEPTFRAYENKVEELLITESGELVMRTMEGTVHESMFPDRFELMQWTGLQDKNGVDIYEGDVVRLGRDTGVIRYDESRYLIDWKAPVTFGLRSDLWYSYEGVEVIGNVHEHPYLLGRQANDSTAILSESEAE